MILDIDGIHNELWGVAALRHIVDTGKRRVEKGGRSCDQHLQLACPQCSGSSGCAFSVQRQQDRPQSPRDVR